MENNQISLEDLENYEDQGMRIREEINFQNSDGFNENDYVCVGSYTDIVYDENGGWTKLWLIGDDIGDGDFVFYLKDDKIYLHKDDIMTEKSYHEMFKSVIDVVFGSIGHTIDFRGLES